MRAVNQSGSSTGCTPHQPARADLHVGAGGGTAWAAAAAAATSGRERCPGPLPVALIACCDTLAASCRRYGPRRARAVGAALPGKRKGRRRF